MSTKRLFSKPLITLRLPKEGYKYAGSLIFPKTFEGLVLMPRTMPFKTKFLPDFKIDYGFEDINSEIPLREEKEVKIFKEEKE